MNDIKMIHGIDALYYFCHTNEDYDDLFLDILDQMQHAKGKFEKRYIEYENSDINITINETPLTFKGKAEGFYWFMDINEFFKIGFKDKATNTNLNDIRVQLQGIGIYTVGIRSLIDFINNDLLKDCVHDFFPITRVDLNTFVQYDFGFITKEMFATRKRSYSMISEIGSATVTQTIYVGKKPFLLRLYNKKEELKKNRKKELMYEYFANNGFDIEKDIFNLEFQMHRGHLTQFNISTTDDLLKNAVKLFKRSMDDIRLIDIDSISDDAIKHNNKHRANTHKIWEHIKESYDLKEFLQTSLPLERIKRSISIYDDHRFKIEIVAVLRRAFINNLVVELEHMDAFYFEAKRSLKETTTKKQMEKTYEDLDNYINPETGLKEKARLLNDGTIIKPVNVVSVSELNDLDLFQYLDKLTTNKNLSDKDNHLWQVAHNEAMKRNLIPVIGRNEANEDES